MRVLVACEESQAVCIAFRERGHEAFSCDLQECSGGHPEWHLQMDVFEAIKLKEWDMMIAFPPCTYLSKAGARWWKQEGREEKSLKAFEFVMKLYNSNIAKIAIENPRGKLNNYWRCPDQIIQPWWFGDPFSKATCLWLKNIPPLMATNICSEFRTFMPSNTGGAKRGQKHTKGIPKNQREASKTFPGIAKAMAEQWG
jgi:site-specific DNA-cytosine methylase